MTENRALQGIRVVNLSENVSGAVLGQFFADHGAEVVLVERAGGSPLRAQAAWPAWARGTRSIEADLDDSAVHALAASADVIVDTFRPGVLERHGLGYETLAANNPRLIMTSITGFGRTGPMSHLKGYEGILQAKLGIADQFSGQVQRDGPSYSTVPMCTISATELAIAGTLVALFEREESGLGQRVDATLVQAIAAHDTWNWMISFWARKFPEAFQAAPVVDAKRRVPNSYLSYALLQALTKDGRWLQFSQSTPKLFKQLLTALDMAGPEWEGAWEDEDIDRREAFWEAMLTAVRQYTVAEWQVKFDEHKSLFAEIFRSGTELMDHPQLVHDGHVQSVETDEFGAVRQLKPFVQLSETPGSGDAPPPRLDADAGLAWSQGGDAASDGSAGAPPRGLPLEGVTIVELGSFYAALFGATILADLGARVIKVEQLDGDPIRHQVGMPEIGGVKVTQGKESIAVDMRKPEGLAIVKQLIAQADVLLYNFRAGFIEQIGLDEATVRAINPDIIYHAAPGFGTGLPQGHRPAYAPTIGAGSGLARRNVGASVPENPELSLDEIKDGALRLTTANITVHNADGYASMGVACGMMLALFARKRGLGSQSVLTTMLLTIGYVLSEDMLEYVGRPAAPTPDKGIYGLSPLYRLYETSQGWVFLAAPTERDWDRLVAALPQAALDDERFATAEGRQAAAAELAEVLASAMRQRTATEWEQLLTAADIACAEVVKGPIQDVMMAPGGLAEQLGLSTEVEHPIFEQHPRMKALVQFGRSTTRAEAGILCGQHTDAILRELGHDEDAVADLFSRDVIGFG